MLFLVDESTGKKLALILANELDVLYVGDILQSSTDEQVLSFAQKHKRILITNDKDFGELIYRLKKPSCGVLLLRIPDNSPQEKASIILRLLKKINITGKFVVVTKNGIRLRML